MFRYYCHNSVIVILFPTLSVPEYPVLTAFVLPDVLKKIALLPDIRGRPRRRSSTVALVIPAAVDVIGVEITVQVWPKRLAIGCVIKIIRPQVGIHAT